MSKFRIVIWVEARKGIGHFRVAASLTKALEKLNCAVFVATSRPEIFNFLYNDADQICSGESSIINEKHSPAREIGGEPDFINLLKEVKPNAVVFEMWPMRRGVFDELIIKALKTLKEINRDAKVCSLIRDVYSDPFELSSDRQREAAKLVERFIDLVLVRGDGQIKIQETWSDVIDTRSRIEYVGYFGAQKEQLLSARNDKTDDWLVAMGGGWFDGSRQLSEIIIDLHKKMASEKSICKFYLPSELIDSNSIHSKNINAVGLDSSYLSQLNRSGLAILQAGYNSVIEAIDLKIPAVFVSANNKFTSGEQRFRLKRFNELGIIGGSTPWQSCDEISLSSLREAVAKSLQGEAKQSVLSFMGAQKAAEMILALIENK